MDALIVLLLTVAASAGLFAVGASRTQQASSGNGGSGSTAAIDWDRINRITRSCTNARQYTALALKWATAYRVPLNWVMATIVNESCGNPMALGDQGRSYGLMQINAGAHTTRLAKHGLKPTDLYDPNNNIMIGTEYLRELSDRILSITPTPPIDLGTLVRQAYRGPAATFAALKSGSSPVVYADTVAKWQQTLA